jgi:hypothetical protein
VVCMSSLGTESVLLEVASEVAFSRGRVSF